MEWVIGLIIIFVLVIITGGFSKSSTKTTSKQPNSGPSQSQNHHNHSNSNKHGKDYSDDDISGKISLENEVRKIRDEARIAKKRISNQKRQFPPFLKITLTPAGLLKNPNERYSRAQVTKSPKSVLLNIVHQRNNPYDQKAIRVYHSNVFIGFVTKQYTDGLVDKFCFKDDILKSNICLNWDGNTFLLTKTSKQLKMKTNSTVGIRKTNTVVPNSSAKGIRPNWKNYQKILSQNYITTLYHFTDRSNINSIRKNGGLYSWFYMENNGIHIPSPGGSQFSRQLDRRKGLHDYVRLSFNMHHPMMYIAKKEGRIKNPQILEIDPQVIYWATSIFSDRNATDSSSKIGPNISDFNNINFNVATQNNFIENDMERKLGQAEILIKTHIPIKYITI
jgi:hypothetical protein